MLIVIIDKRSTNSAEELAKAVKPFEVIGVKVIPVIVGNNAQPRDVQPITTNTKNILAVKKNKNPQILGEKIMDKVVQGI